MAREYWTHGPEGVKGPYSEAELRALVAQGKVTPEMDISLDGKSWVSASRVPGLFPNATGAASATPGSVPPGSVPPGSVPPGSVPPGSAPPGDRAADPAPVDAGRTEVSRFERFIFAATRMLCALGALGAVMGIGLALLVLLGRFDKSTAVSYSEVQVAMAKATPAPSVGGSADRSEIDESAGYAIPADLEPHFSGSNRAVLVEWLKQLESDEERAEFMAELSQALKSAKSQGLSPAAVSNTYRDVKFAKIAQARESKYETLALKAGAAGALFGLILLMVIFALVLVLLAIERHGRRIVARFATSKL